MQENKKTPKQLSGESADKPQILAYFSKAELGEEEQAALNTLAKLNGQSFTVRALIPAQNVNFIEFLDSIGIEYDVLAGPKPLTRSKGFKDFFKNISDHWAYIRKLSRYYRMYAFESVYSIGMRAHKFSIFLKMRFNIPLFWHLWEVFYPGLRMVGYRRMIFFFVDKVFASSLTVAHSLGRLELLKNKIKVINPGYEKPETVQIENLKDPVLAVKVTPLLDEGFSTFLIALSTIKKSIPGIKTKLVLDSLDQDAPKAITDKIEGLGLQDQIEFCVLSQNSLTPVLDFIKEKNICLFIDTAIHLQAFPKAMVEALGAGVPVVAMRIGSASEYVINNKTGFLVSPGNAQEMTDSIQKILTDDVLRKSFSNESLKEFETRFLIEQHLEIITAELKRHLGEEAPKKIEASPTKEDKKAA